MKQKKLALPMLILVAGLVLSILVSMMFSIAKRPTVTEHTFPISITYEFGGETFTIEDEFHCSFNVENSPYIERYYTGELAGNDEDLPCGDYLIQAYDDGALILLTRLFAGYMMGDPQYDQYYTEYYRFEPQIAYYVYDEYTEYYEEDGVLEPYDIRIVDWDYPDPVENTFKTSHLVPLKARNVLPLLAVSLLTLLACMIFVRRDPDLSYRAIDKLSIVLNFAIAILALPFLAIVCMLMDALGTSEGLIEQFCFCIPAIGGFGLAASVGLRRRGFRKSAFFVQFAGIAALALLLLLEQFS